jgi:RNA-directed DNA polymerase
MTAKLLSTGASLARFPKDWSSYSWPGFQKHVLRLQVRIAKAEREGKRGKVRALQRLLTCSFSAKCLAVKRVTSSSGSKTPGVDGMVWRTDHQKTQAIFDLKRNGYTPKPLRRIYIPKKLGSKELRPLSIPCMIDRAQQALHLLSIEPLVEEWADPNAYGFRLKRSTQDAKEQCFTALSKKTSATLILEGDIRKCFDTISHSWLQNNIPMDKTILRKFLKSGFVEHKKLYPTLEGCPQGGVISAALIAMSLSGLERKLLPTSRHQKEREKINVVAYADDFIVTANSKEILESRILPILTEALKVVGLELSMSKTKITSITDGFDFLGFHFRKYPNGKLLIKPSKASIQRFLKEIKLVVKKSGALPTDKLIYTLNSRITGWVNYYRSCVASRVFSQIDSVIFQVLMRWCLKRHDRKGKQWIVKKYFTRLGGDNWRFHCITKDKNGKSKPLYLKNAADTKIRRHLKIISKANPFNPLYKEYFDKREKDRKLRAMIINNTSSAGLRTIQPY